MTAFDQGEIDAAVEALTKYLAEGVEEKFGASRAEELRELLRK